MSTREGAHPWLKLRPRFLCADGPLSRAFRRRLGCQLPVRMETLFMGGRGLSLGNQGL